MSAWRIVGILLTGLGAAMAAAPNWFEPLIGVPGLALDTFEAIEQRVRGGMVLGFGLALVARTKLRPWSLTIAMALFYVLLGALLARLLGMVIEGPHPRQWLYVAIEVVLLAVVALWWRRADRGDRRGPPAPADLPD